MATSSPEAVKKLLDNMQSDLRSLSLECRKKFPPVKEVRRLAAAATDASGGSGPVAGEQQIGRNVFSLTGDMGKVEWREREQGRAKSGRGRRGGGRGRGEGEAEG